MNPRHIASPWITVIRSGRQVRLVTTWYVVGNTGGIDGDESSFNFDDQMDVSGLSGRIRVPGRVS